LAVKRPAQTNGHGAGTDLKRRAGDIDAEIGRAHPTPRGMRRLIDPALLADPYAAANFIGNVLEASTETSIIGTDLDGSIQLWNEGARRLYGYEPEEVIGKANSTLLLTAEDVTAGLAQEMMSTAIEKGKYEGSLVRRRKNGTTFPARIVVTPRRNNEGDAIGFLFISRGLRSPRSTRAP
jgi:PAS domain S-box-containing protein